MVPHCLAKPPEPGRTGSDSRMFLEAALARADQPLDQLRDLLVPRGRQGTDAVQQPVRDLAHSVIMHAVASGESMKAGIIGQLDVLTGENVALLMVAGACFGHQKNYPDKIVKTEQSQQLLLRKWRALRLRFIHVAWDIGPTVAA
jgi:hypothetical protein